MKEVLMNFKQMVPYVFNAMVGVLVLTSTWTVTTIIENTRRLALIEEWKRERSSTVDLLAAEMKRVQIDAEVAKNQSANVNKNLDSIVFKLDTLTGEINKLLPRLDERIRSIEAKRQ